MKLNLRTHHPLASNVRITATVLFLLASLASCYVGDSDSIVIDNESGTQITIDIFLPRNEISIADKSAIDWGKPEIDVSANDVGIFEAKNLNNLSVKSSQIVLFRIRLDDQESDMFAAVQYRELIKSPYSIIVYSDSVHLGRTLKPGRDITVTE